MNRRHFFQQTSSLIAASLMPNSGSSESHNRKQRLFVGAQTNTFGVPIKPLSRLLQVIGTLGALGFEGFETNAQSLEAGASKPAEWRREFEARNIRLIAAHTGASLYRDELAEKTVEDIRRMASYTAEMGASHLIVSGNRLPHVGGKLDLAAVHNTTAGLNRLGEIAQRAGLKFCYHNHVQEFEDDPSEMDFILKETDPKLVWLNYDVGNAYGTGPDAATFSREHFRRIAIYHIKDVMRDDHNEVVATELGAGKIDLKGVVEPLLHSNWKGWLTLEQEGDYPHGVEHPEALLRRCRAYIQTITGV